MQIATRGAESSGAGGGLAFSTLVSDSRSKRVVPSGTSVCSPPRNVTRNPIGCSESIRLLRHGDYAPEAALEAVSLRVLQHPLARNILARFPYALNAERALAD